MTGCDEMAKTAIVTLSFPPSSVRRGLFFYLSLFRSPFIPLQ